MYLTIDVHCTIMLCLHTTVTHDHSPAVHGRACRSHDVRDVGRSPDAPSILTGRFAVTDCEDPPLTSQTVSSCLIACVTQLPAALCRIQFEPEGQSTPQRRSLHSSFRRF